MKMNTHDSSAEDVTAQFTADILPDSWTPLDIDVAAISHQGHVRENNEDRYLVVRFGRSLENLATNLDAHVLESSYTLNGYGMLVADGMGGMAAGEVASGMALSKLVELVIETSDWTMSLQHDRDVQRVLQRMTDRFLQVDAALREKAKGDPTLRGMGTTLTVAGALGSDLVVGHVGDSRAYLLRDRRLRQLTTDHTLAQALIDAGVAKRDDPATRSMRHVLTAAIGALDERVEPQVQRFRLYEGDKLLLCTDGLTEMVDDDTITTVLREAKSAQTASQSLVDLALAAGGVDNITIIVAQT
jgi:serine/threonine protein phosphatase PrpC